MKKTIEVRGIQIRMSHREQEEFLSLTDIARGFERGEEARNPDYLIQNWLRLGNTVEFLAAWESVHNPEFNPVGSDWIKTQITDNAYRLSVKTWLEKTSAIGITASAGRYGGTFAHRDIAVQFCYWLSPLFQVYLIKEFQRLKESEAAALNLEWKVRRELAKVNYGLHAHFVKSEIIDRWQVRPSEEFLHYASEADLLNLALFGMTAAQWREANPELATKNGNIRDTATLAELTVLSNLESYNAILLRNGVDKESRFRELQRTAQQQLEVFESISQSAIKRLTTG